MVDYEVIELYHAQRKAHRSYESIKGTTIKRLFQPSLNPVLNNSVLGVREKPGSRSCLSSRQQQLLSRDERDFSTNLSRSQCRNETLSAGSNIAISKSCLVGRRVLGHAGRGTKRANPIDVLHVQSILTKSVKPLSAATYEIRPALSYTNSLISRVLRASWATHWAIEVDGDYYELDRLEPYVWDSWRAKVVVRDVKKMLKRACVNY